MVVVGARKPVEGNWSVNITRREVGQTVCSSSSRNAGPRRRSLNTGRAGVGCYFVFVFLNFLELLCCLDSGLGGA